MVSIHDTVLEAMGIHSIVHPEQDSADRLTKQINFKSTLENYQLDDAVYGRLELSHATYISNKGNKKSIVVADDNIF